MTNKQHLEAQPAYENAHLVARDLLVRIDELLHDLPAPGDDEHPIRWTHVGEITHVAAQLAGVIEFLERP
jgi:hypothetical protein